MASVVVLLRNIILPVAVLSVFGVVFLLSDEASAQIVDPSQYDIADVYSISGSSDTTSVYFRFNRLPRGTVNANWPLRTSPESNAKRNGRSNFCSTSYPTNSIYKTLPTVPQMIPQAAVRDDMDGIIKPSPLRQNWTEYTSSDTLNENPAPGQVDEWHESNRRGAYRSWPGGCDSGGILKSGYDGDIFKIAAIRDAGTYDRSEWGVRGYSISPKAYGGWAQSADGYTNPGSLFRAPYRFGSCRSGGASPASKWIDESLNPVLASKSLKAIGLWGTDCRDDNDYLSSMYGASGYNSEQISKIRTMGGSTYGVYSNGMTLFRTVFNLTSEDIAKIKQSKEGGGGLFIDFVADDFYVMYLNGSWVHSNDFNSTFRSLPLDPNQLKVGNNLLAMEVFDKTLFMSGQNFSGVGLGFAISRKEPKGYRLKAETTCSPMQVKEGELTRVNCDHKVDKIEGQSGGRVNYEVKCEHVDVDGRITPINSRPSYGMDPYFPYVDSLGGCTILTNGGFEEGPKYTQTIKRGFNIQSSYKKGEKICTWIVADPGWRTVSRRGTISSNKVCIVVGDETTPDVPPVVSASPPVHFYRGDIFSNKGMKFSNLKVTDGIGSRVQYAAYANDVVPGDQLATASSYTSPDTMMFAYTASPVLRGKMGMPAASAGVNTTGLTADCTGSADFKIINWPSPKSRAYCTSDRRLTDGEGYSTIREIVVRGNITIGSNIIASTAQQSVLSKMPHLTIRATGDIIIEAGVTRIDATLVAGGKLQTCEVKPTSPAQCNQQLVINGPTKATKYNLYRIYSDSSDLKKPAEIFRYHPAAIMAPYSDATTSAMLVVENEVELPARY